MLKRRQFFAFSLVELVIVIVIIGIVAAIAVPNISRATKGAADAALKADLAVVRKAIQLYKTEHARLFPTEDNFDAQMTMYTDINGNAQPSKDSTHIFGPYLQSIPTLPVDGQGGNSGKRGDTQVKKVAAAKVAWLYVELTGEIKANTETAKDETGTLYSDY